MLSTKWTPKRETRQFRTEREVVFADTRFKAFVSGRREAMTTKLNIPLQGVVIDGVMAVDESPVLIIVKPTEYARFGIDETKLNETSVAALVGGDINIFLVSPS